jgi:hypothetical protein
LRAGVNVHGAQIVITDKLTKGILKLMALTKLHLLMLNLDNYIYMQNYCIEKDLILITAHLCATYLLKLLEQTQLYIHAELLY